MGEATRVQSPAEVRTPQQERDDTARRLHGMVKAQDTMIRKQDVRIQAQADRLARIGAAALRSDWAGVSRLCRQTRDTDLHR